MRLVRYIFIAVSGKYTGSMNCISMWAYVFLLLAGSLQAAALGTDVSCPPWFLPTSVTVGGNTGKACFCSPSLPSRIMCFQKTNSTYLKVGSCAFWNNATGRTMVGACPYVFPGHLIDNQLLKLPQDVTELNFVMCDSLTREVGQIMCGRCANGTGPSVTSVNSQCVECKAVSVLYYILLRYLPATIIFLIILSVQFDVTSVPMAHYILYCNIILLYSRTKPSFLTIVRMPYQYIVRAFLTLNSIWSFDPLLFLSPPLCFSTHIEDIDIVFFEMLATLYPFFLLVLAYVVIELHARGFKPVVFLWRPLHQSFIRWRRSWNPRASLVQSFATIFFISYAKLIFLVSTPLNHTSLTEDDGHVLLLKFVYIDPTVPYGHGKHICLLGMSALIFIFIILPPILVLMAYPTQLFRRLQNRLSSRVSIAIDTFVSTFQGCYKDGLNGTRDYRSLSGGILAFGVLMIMFVCGSNLLVEVGDRQPILQWQTGIIFLVIFTVAVALSRPYKSDAANTTLLCLLAILIISATVYLFARVHIGRHNVFTLFALVVANLPHCVFYGYVVCKIRSEIARVCKRYCRSDTRLSQYEELP